jgi:hypothetical protein
VVILTGHWSKQGLLSDQADLAPHQSLSVSIQDKKVRDQRFYIPKKALLKTAKTLNFALRRNPPFGSTLSHVLDSICGLQSWQRFGQRITLQRWPASIIGRCAASRRKGVLQLLLAALVRPMLPTHGNAVAASDLLHHTVSQTRRPKEQRASCMQQVEDLGRVELQEEGCFVGRAWCGGPDGQHLQGVRRGGVIRFVVHSHNPHILVHVAATIIVEVGNQWDSRIPKNYIAV